MTSMTDRKLDALVAEKVMGMKFYEARPMFASDLYTDERGVIVDLPFYSTNIAAAWGVVEKLRDIAYPFSMDCDHKGRWFVHGANEDCLGFDYSAPRAICLAALKAIGVEAA